MSEKEFLWLLVSVWGLFSLSLLGAQVFITRRFFKKMEGTLGPKIKRKRVKSALNKRDSALIAFDSKNNVFCWDGKFEENEGSYTLNAETGYACLKLEKGGSGLTIFQYEHTITESRATTLVPYKMELNGRTIYSTSFLKESGEKKLICEVLSDYFKRGIKRNAEFLSAESRETVDALIFGYHTLSRFKASLKEAYPDFWQEIKDYQRKSLQDSLSHFQPAEKSEDTLEIEIKKAIFEEDYERAAKIRDELKKLNQPGSPRSIEGRGMKEE